MLTYRTFRNTDPPILTAIWQSRAGQPGLVQPVSPQLLEEHVFAKLYFDYPGLIIAYDDGRPLGFAHAGFSATENENGVSREQGATCVVLARPDCDEAAVASGLLERAEDYLHHRGAKTIYGGGIRPLNAFYLGLYGGSELPGVLESDVVLHRVYAARGYQEIDRTHLFQRDLTSFEAIMDRRQMQIRRQMVVEVTADPPTRTWWEACTLGVFELTRFSLLPKSGGPAAATAIFRSMDPEPVTGRSRGVGLLEVWVDDAFRRRGLAIFVVSEAFRQFLREGITSVEVQAMQHNTAALGLYRKLGFQHVDCGSVLRKDEG